MVLDFIFIIWIVKIFNLIFMKLFFEINLMLVNVFFFVVKIFVCLYRLNNFFFLIVKKRKKEKKRGKLEEMKYI